MQVGYIVPLWRYLRRKGLRDVAMGLLMAACATLVVNAVIDYLCLGRRCFDEQITSEISDSVLL